MKKPCGIFLSAIQAIRTMPGLYCERQLPTSRGDYLAFLPSYIGTQESQHNFSMQSWC